MPSEIDCRWDDFQGGRAIAMPDGQTWFFHEPEAIVGGPGWSFGAAPDLNVGLSVAFGRILAKWGRATNDDDRASATLEAAWFLLARNYDVTPAQFEQIMLGASEWGQEQIDRLAGDFALLVGTPAVRLVAVMRPEVMR